MGFHVSDRFAVWTAWVTIAVIVCCFFGFFAAIAYNSELPWLIKSPWFPVVLLGMALAAWCTAYFVMKTHQNQASYISSRDVASWKLRTYERFGILIPFIYLLASRKQRRVVQYLGEDRK